MDLATGAMGSLLLKLGDLLAEEYKLQTGVKEDVEYLKRELASMYTALRVVGEVPRDQLNPQVKLWADDVRDLSYRMEDIVDKFLVRVEGTEPAVKPHKLRRLMKKMGDLFAKGKTRHEISDEIKGIRARVKEAAERRDRYRVSEVVANPDGGTKVDPRLLALYKDRKDIVGIDGALNELTKRLTDEDGDVSKQLKLISIFGFGGLGKTTLAKAVYDQLQPQFECSAFVPVGRNPDVQKLLKDILFGIDKKKCEALNSLKPDERQLIDELRDSLKNKRYIIVIDDIWDLEVWKWLECAFVDNSCASRIITTTRILEVAKKTGEVYRLEPLSHDLAEELFHTRVFGGRKQWPHNHPTEIYDKILHKCGGVPLAIITIASLLVGKPVEVWSKVYNSIGFGNDGNKDVENTRKILLFSYYDLPCHLRTCLLHLSLYPEDHLIEKDSLIWKWVVEGFVKEEIGVGLFEIGERYFNELVNKSMILPVEVPHRGIITGCRVHDMVLDMICLLAKDENFVTILSSHEQYTSSHSKARRLSVGQRTDPLASTGMSQVRSFNALCRNDKLPSLSCFEVLRALALEGDTLDGEDSNCLVHLEKLVHLRYLGLGALNISELPEKIGDLKFLQALILSCKRLKELPQSVGQLSQLKCLHAYNSNIRVPDWIGNLTSLEDLYMEEIDESSNFVYELGKLIELRKLRVRKTLCLTNASSIQAWAESLVKLKEIEVIEIGYVAANVYDDATYWKGNVLPRQLRVFHSVYRQPGMLARINSFLLPSLSHLSVYVDSPDLESFGRFENLVTLKLEMEGIQQHSSMGGPGAFPKLRVFETDGTPAQFLVGDMQSLEYLKFRVELARDSMYGEVDFDISSLGNLSLLQEVNVDICYATGAMIDEAEAAFEHAIDILPSRPILHVRRDEIILDDYISWFDME